MDLNEMTDTELDAATAPVTEPTESTEQTDKGTGEPFTATVTASGRKGSKSNTADHKPVKRSMPFGEVIFSRPDREVKVERTNKKGEKTGVVARLVADVIIPLIGNVLTVKTGIWCDTRYSREDGGFVDTYSVSLPRNTFVVADDARGFYDDWRESLLTKYDAWSQTEAARAGSKSSVNTTPRLVKVRKADGPTETPKA